MKNSNKKENDTLNRLLDDIEALEEVDAILEEEEKEKPELSEVDEKVRFLVEETDCHRELAEQILELASGDVKNALEVIRTLSDRAIFIVRGRFKSIFAQSYGIFILFLNVIRGTLEKVMLAASQSSITYMYDINIRWDVLERVIHGIRTRKIHFDEKLTKKIDEGIRKIFAEDKTLFQDIISPQKEAFRKKLTKRLGDLLNDQEVKVKLNIDQISELTEPAREGEGGLSQTTIEEEKKELEERPEEVAPERERPRLQIREPHIRLRIEPVIAPISGIQVTELSPGNRLIVKVTDPTELGKFLAELMGGRKGEEIVPLVVTVEDVAGVENDPEVVKVVVKFGPGVYGEGIVPRDVKVHSESHALRDMGAAEEKPVPLSTEAEKEVSFLIVMIGLLSIVIIVLLFVLIFR